MREDDRLPNSLLEVLLSKANMEACAQRFHNTVPANVVTIAHECHSPMALPVCEECGAKKFSGGRTMEKSVIRNKGAEDAGPSTGPHHFHMDGWLTCAPFERLLNITIVAARDGLATLTMPFLVDYANGAGLMHGGVLVGLADTAVVMAIKSLIPPCSHFATVSLETRFLLPVKKGTVTAKAEVVSREGVVLQGRATVFDEEERAVMEFASVFRIAKDPAIRGITFEKGIPTEGMHKG